MSVLVWVATLIAATLAGWPVTWLVLRLAGGAPDSAASDEDAADGEGPADDEGVLRGGVWIGLLERLAVAGTILLGYPAGIAVIVAIKGLGRFPELRHHPAASERFIIGTLASLIWASAVGAGGAAILAALS